MILELLTYTGAVALYSTSSQFLHLLGPSKWIGTILLKCLPVLVLFVISMLHTRSSSASSSIFLKVGLLASAVGDGCLVLDQYFLPGVAAFGIAHVCYIIVFGLQPRKWHLVPLVVVFAIPAFFIVVWPIAKGIFLVALIFYTALLMVMVWRALALATSRPSFANTVCAIGAISFITSDVSLIIEKFHAPFVFSRFCVMGLYYLSQVAICFAMAGLVPGDILKSSHKTH